MRRAERVKVQTIEDMGRSVENLIADGTPRLLEKDGEIVALIIRPSDNHQGTGIWETYDPVKLREAYERTPPLFQSLDREKFIQEMREAREQDPRRWEEDLQAKDD